MLRFCSPSLPSDWSVLMVREITPAWLTNLLTRRGGLNALTSVHSQFWDQPRLQHIAAHFGFVKIGSQLDEENGLEEIYERYFAV